MTGLKKLRVKPQVHISEDDWDVMTRNGSLLNASGELGQAEFEVSLCPFFALPARAIASGHDNIGVALKSFCALLSSLLLAESLSQSSALSQGLNCPSTP